MSERLRVRPPAIDLPRELAWVLARAFAAPASSPAVADPAAALDLAARLGLLPRLAVRGDLAVIFEVGFEIGRDAGLDAESAARLRAERDLAAARELRFDETLARVADAARAVGTEIAPLKGRALVLAGEARPGQRPSVDLDLLAPAAGLAPLQAELVRRGFVAGTGVRHDHQLAPLRHPTSETVELHRYLPGVRLDGDASASWDDLARAGLLAAPHAPATWPAVRLVARPVRRAHALVHALAQHGLTARLPGWLLIGDLLDLGDAASDGTEWRAWIARDVTSDEIDAAMALAAIVAAGRDPFADAAPPAAARLARHFVACALDPDYAEALKLRGLESPLGEGSRLAARWRLVGRALIPPAHPAGPAPSPLRRAGRWLLRPFQLMAKAVRAILSARRVRRA